MLKENIFKMQTKISVIDNTGQIYLVSVCVNPF